MSSKASLTRSARTITRSGRRYTATVTALNDGEFAYAPFTSIDLRVLFHVCENGTSFSSVTLLQDLYLVTADAVMSVETLQWILTDLNQQGWLTYRLGEGGVFITIRPTQAGYEMMGYAPPAEVLLGRHRSHASDSPKHPGDRTDFRVLASTAQGGPIERMTLYEHHTRYPEHHHPLSWLPTAQLLTLNRELGVASSNEGGHNGGSAAPGVAAEGEAPVEPSIGDIVRKDLADGMSVTGVRSRYGLGVGTIYKIRDNPNYSPRPERSEANRRSAATKSAVRQQRASVSNAQAIQTSLQERIRAILENATGMIDVNTLRDRLLADGHATTAGTVDLHGIVHVLYPMRRRHEVEFAERGSGASKRIVKIRLPGRVWREEQNTKPDMDDVEPGAVPAPAPALAPQNPPVAPQAGGTPPVGTGTTPAPLLARWPVLQSLLQRTSKVSQAVTLLREAGMDAAADLIEGDVDGTPLELEVLDLIKYLERSVVNNRHVRRLVELEMKEG